ncbi:MAG: LLM class flavin-dependent oxidoreductase [Candidatus Acidiferrales bacterium]|jgi:alkanesulfonate monooxygenase SsuD/methylene tetrahydromethanopterin reductase-like flavin-dependent oxidoreductase (luciferase family)
MHVGYGSGFQHLGGYSDRQFLREEIGNCLMAEELGMDSIWATEHHFDDYSISPDVLQLMSYLAGKTKRVKLGSMVIVVPWHDPMRLAEQIVLLDHHSDGRFILGVGRGLARREFEGLRIDQNEGRRRFDEYTSLVLGALETGFMEGGDTVKQPRREIRPRPFKSFKGRSFAAAASADSVPVVAKLGLGMLVILQKAWDLVTKDFELYHKCWREFHPNVEPPKPFCSGFCFVDESKDRAEELARKYLSANYRAALEHYEMLGKHFEQIKSYERYAEMSKYLNQIGADKAVEDYIQLMAWGTPQQVLEKFSKWKNLIDMQGVMPNFNFGGMSHEESVRNVKCFAKHCMPELKSWPSATLEEPKELALTAA